MWCQGMQNWEETVGSICQASTTQTITMKIGQRVVNVVKQGKHEFWVWSLIQTQHFPLRVYNLTTSLKSSWSFCQLWDTTGLLEWDDLKPGVSSGHWSGFESVPLDLTVRCSGLQQVGVSEARPGRSSKAGTPTVSSSTHTARDQEKNLQQIRSRGREKACRGHTGLMCEYKVYLTI